MNISLQNREIVAQYVIKKLESLKENSQLTMTISPVKYADYFVYTVTSTSSEGTDEILLKQSIDTLQELTPDG
jgi:pyruvate/oxaloacetate carboxyltransferase